jgi:exodeoxyribonuclease V alpha subunit
MKGAEKEPRPLQKAGTQGALLSTSPPVHDAGTLDGEVLRVTYESQESGFRVLRVTVPGEAQPAVVVGFFPAAAVGTRIRATGKWERDRKHGQQFRAETVLAIAPSTIDGLERYLGSGIIHGIGPKYAKRIVEAFGIETLEVLDRAPERLYEVAGLGPTRAGAIAKAWRAHRAVGAIMIFLQAHGASASLAGRIYKRFGANAIDIVSRHPYRLALDVWGVGFKTADHIAREIGISADAPERAQAGVLQTLHDLSARGHVYAPRGELVTQAALMLERDEASVDEAVNALAASGHVKTEALRSGDLAVYPAEFWHAEDRVARRLRALMTAPFSKSKGLEGHAIEATAAFEARTKVTLATAQREAIEQAATHKVLVITGGPGVGKTTIVRAMLALFARRGLTVRLAAPTGRAAKRMSEATGSEATTLHRLLEFEPRSRTFARQHGRPIDADAIVVDEASMLDLALADALLQATADGTRLILVGDVDQLPSVGPGAVLRDVIASKRVPTVFLTQIFRQAAGSLIVENAHRIHDGVIPESAKGKSGEFYVIERAEAEAAAELIRELVTKRIPQGFGLDPVRDIQVLTPMHHGPAGAIALNERLQQSLNPSGPSVQRRQRVLRLGDKVMQLRNDYDREIYNGDVGVIVTVAADEQRLVVAFDGREVTYEESDLDDLTLAYATSIHKSQGSEYPAVVIPVLTSHFIMLSRNLVYTAVTRGKKLVILVTSPRAMGLALAETRKEERKTDLAERLRSDAEP